MLILSVLYCNFQTVMLHGFHSLLLFLMTMFVRVTDLFGTFTLQIKSACRGKHYVTTLLSVEKYFTLDSISVDCRILSGKLSSWQT